METIISSFNKKNPFHDDYMLNRIKSDIALISPNCFEGVRESLIMQLFINNKIILLDNKRHCEFMLSELVEKYQINKKNLYHKVEIIDDASNPFSNSNSLNEIVLNNYLNDDIGNQIDMSATGILTQTQEAKELEKEFDSSFIDMFPIAAPFFKMRHIWMPMSWRTRFILKTSMQYEAAYVTHDTYESDIHDSFFHFGLRDSRSVRKLYSKNHLRFSVDHKPKMLLLLMHVFKGMHGNEWKSEKAVTTWWNDSDTVKELGYFLDNIADQLYSCPYFISEKLLLQKITSRIINLLPSLFKSHITTALMNGIGNIPLPFFIPNPIGLYNAYQDYCKTKKFNEEHLWLIYLINISKASTYFKWSFDYPIPNLEVINLRDDRIYTVVGKWACSKKTMVLHRSTCSELLAESADDIVLYLDDLGNRPMIDAKKCRICW